MQGGGWLTTPMDLSNPKERESHLYDSRNYYSRNTIDTRVISMGKQPFSTLVRVVNGSYDGSLCNEIQKERTVKRRTVHTPVDGRTSVESGRLLTMHAHTMTGRITVCVTLGRKDKWQGHELQSG